jgi:hypothetical protein
MTEPVNPNTLTRMFREWKKARLGEREARETTVTQITGAALLHQVLMRVAFAKDAFEMYGLIAYAPTGEAEVTAGFKALIKVLRGAEASAVIVCAVKDVIQARQALLRWLEVKMKALVGMIYAQMLMDDFDEEM